MREVINKYGKRRKNNVRKITRKQKDNATHTIYTMATFKVRSVIVRGIMVQNVKQNGYTFDCVSE